VDARPPALGRDKRGPPVACDRGGFPPMTVSLFYGCSFLISVLRFEIGFHGVNEIGLKMVRFG